MESKDGFIIGRQTLDVRRWTAGYEFLTSIVQRPKSKFSDAPHPHRARVRERFRRRLLL